jgi:hypothetical protein
MAQVRDFEQTGMNEFEATVTGIDGWTCPIYSLGKYTSAGESGPATVKLHETVGLMNEDIGYSETIDSSLFHGSDLESILAEHITELEKED